MNNAKKILIIGAAPKYLIDSTIERQEISNAQFHLLAPIRDKDQYTFENVSYFKGTFHPFLIPLVRSILTFKPDEVLIVCGMTYDHDNIVEAVSYYSHFKKTEVKIAVRDKVESLGSKPRTGLFKEFFKWIGLGAIAFGIKLLTPIRTIRAAEIYSTRIGHLAMESEIYMAEKELGLHTNNIDLFFFKNNEVANETLAKLVTQKININSKYKYILDAIRRFNFEKKHEVLLNTRKLAFCRDSDCLIQLTNTHLEFSKQQERHGLSETIKMGLSPNLPHVCVLGRDSAYLVDAISSYNDADMQQIRNMNIATFKKSIKYLTSMNYNVLRMGSIVQDKLHIDEDKFLDYANTPYRTDFMDVYLAAKCHFFVGVQSGLIHIPMIFRKPCLNINVVRTEFIHFCSPDDLAIFKLMRSKSKNRILSISEIIESGISRWRVEDFANSDIELIDNTEDEIFEATKEMHQRVSGTWKSTKEDINLLNKFRSHLKISKYNSQYNTPISAYFLRKHASKIL